MTFPLTTLRADNIAPGEISREDAKKRALRMLERRDYGSAELRQKLIEKGVSAADAEAVTEKMLALGFINDENYARLVARHYAAKGYGDARIREELRRRRLPRELWDGAVSELDERGDTIDALLSRRLRSASPDRDEYRRAASYLVRRGFSWDEVSAAIERARAERSDNE